MEGQGAKLCYSIYVGFRYHYENSRCLLRARSMVRSNAPEAQLRTSVRSTRAPCKIQVVKIDLVNILCISRLAFVGNCLVFWTSVPSRCNGNRRTGIVPSEPRACMRGARPVVLEIRASSIFTVFFRPALIIHYGPLLRVC